MTPSKKELSKRGLSLAGRFERELRGLLQKPFYFQLVASGAVQLPAEPHPRDLYHSFFVTLSTAFTQAFGHTVDLERALCGSDVPDLVERAEYSLYKCVSNENDQKRVSVDTALAVSEELLADIAISTLRSVFLDPTKPIETQHTRMTLHSGVLIKHRCSELLVLLAELLLAGEILAAFPICLITYGKSVDELPWTCFQAAHIEQLLTGIRDLDNARWSLDALQLICSMRPDLAAGTRHKMDQFEGLTRGCVMHAIDPTDTAPLFDALKSLCGMPPERRRQEPLYLIEGLNLDWRGHETLFVDLLRLRDTALARALLEGIYKREECIGTIAIGPIEWWLDWLGDDSDPKAHWWFVDRLGDIFADHLSIEAREAFVAEFNRVGSRYRPVLARFVLWRWRDLTSDDFSEEAQLFLIKDLKRKGSVDGSYGHILGHTATEAFVTDRLVPLLDTQDSVFHRNLVRVLEQAGSRHGRRYTTQ